ncbi:MAG: hypothetical protein H7250_04550 [Flavobacterium sp.]|nr:hypothetical protein [Flavobacterium sp.]
MEQNKLETHMKDKLDSREIQPSAHAWDRLDAMLSVQEEKKTRKPFGFLFIAASIVVLISASLFFFNQNAAKIQFKNDVVTTEIKDTIQKQVNKISTPIVERNREVVSNQSTTNNRQLTTNIQRVSISNQQSVINNQNPLINRDNEMEYLISSDIAIKDLPRIDNNKEIFISNTSIPSDEQLLASMDKAVKQTSKETTVVKVNPKSLLIQVNGELEYSFREKVINKVVKNYKEVKVALANRNEK